jgi:hypothetical protein
VRPSVPPSQFGLHAPRVSSFPRICLLPWYLPRQASTPPQYAKLVLEILSAKTLPTTSSDLAGART